MAGQSKTVIFKENLMSLTELHEQRGRLVTQAREALDEIKSNTDEARSSELNERHDRIMTEFDKIENLIKREKKLSLKLKRAQQMSEHDSARFPIPKVAVATSATKSNIVPCSINFSPTMPISANCREKSVPF